MPFYTTDSIECYMFACITETYESLDKDERRDSKEALEDIVFHNDTSALKNRCEEFLSIDIDINIPLCAAILNTINYDNLNGYLRDWLADCDVDDSDDE